jgi:hypothetical protein
MLGKLEKRGTFHRHSESEQDKGKIIGSSGKILLIHKRQVS